MPRLLDLFSGCGGSATGYSRAGFEVVGVDCVPQPRYPFTHVVADALDYAAQHGRDFDVVTASPPCQHYSKARTTPGATQWQAEGGEYPDLLPATRALLLTLGVPYVIENVPGAPLDGLLLCGTMFGLPLRRHRLFESSILLFGPGHGCRHGSSDLGVYAGKVTRLGTRATAYVAGSGRTHYRPRQATLSEGKAAMGIDWMRPEEMSEAIPPCYTEHVGRQLRQYLEEIA